MSNMDLIAEARRNAPFSEDESLIMRLVNALEVKPRVIATVEELDALPDETVIRSRFGELLELSGGHWYFGEVGGDYVSLPATVLHAPTTEPTR